MECGIWNFDFEIGKLEIDIKMLLDLTLACGEFWLELESENSPAEFWSNFASFCFFSISWR